MRPKPPVSAAATPTPARTPTAAAAATMAPMGRLRAAGCSSRPEAAEAAGLGATATGGCTAVGPGRLPGAAAGARSDPTALAPPDAGVWGTVGSGGIYDGIGDARCSRATCHGLPRNDSLDGRTAVRAEFHIVCNLASASRAKHIDRPPGSPEVSCPIVHAGHGND